MTRYLPTNLREAFEILAWMANTFMDRKARRYYYAIVLWTALMKSLEIAIPWCFGIIVVAITTNTDPAIPLAAFSVAQIIRVYADWRGSRAREFFLGQTFQGMDVTITEAFLGKDIGTHILEHKTLAKSVLDEGRKRGDLLIHLAAFWLADASLVLIITLGVLLFVSLPVAIIIVVAITIGVGLSSYTNKDVVARADVVDEEFRAVMSDRDDRLSALERVMTTGSELEEVQKFKQGWTSTLAKDRNVWLAFLNGNGGRNAFMTIALLAVVWFTAHETSTHAMPVSTFVSLGTWVAVAIAQVNNLSQMERQILWATGPLKALRTALELPPIITLPNDGVRIQDDEPITVEFRNVSFRYPNGPLILHNFSLTVLPGKKVALIGKSGSGKSTIGKLLLRYLDPTEGTILVNGHDLRTLDLRAWRKRVGQINQRTQIFTMSLRDNLLYGMSPELRARFTDDVLWEMMRRFRVDFGADRLKDGLNTKLGKGGEQLSGGEAQRVLILAAVLRNPGFMVIDEATSALDAESQEAVQAALYETLQGGAGAILIAHRLSTTRGCDSFVMMCPVAEATDENQIEATATSLEELAAHSRSFAAIAAKEGVIPAC